MKNELPTLHHRSFQKLSSILDNARQYDLLPGRIGDALVVDAGINTTGCLSVSERLCEVALADLARVRLVPDRTANAPIMRLELTIDYPMAACMGSQWPYWSLDGDYPEILISGSGQSLHPSLPVPDTLKEELGKQDRAILFLETTVLPDEKLIEYLSGEIGLSPHRLILVVVPPSSLVGSIFCASRVVSHAVGLLAHHGFSPGRVVGGGGFYRGATSFS